MIIGSANCLGRAILSSALTHLADVLAIWDQT